MKQTIQIIQNGCILSSVTLEDGSYSLGRDASNDIVLSDASVSKKHAVVTLYFGTITIKDNNSVNGIYYNGNPILEKGFNDTFCVEIGPFTIKTPDKKFSIGKISSLSALGVNHRLLAGNIKTSIFLFISVLMMFTVFTAYRPLRNEVSDIQKREFLRTGILLTRYLGEINRPHLETREYGKIRLNPINLEDGVIYAVVLDTYGRIIAPHEIQGDFFDWDGLSSAYQKTKLTMGDGVRGEKIIFNPISLQKKVIGAVVIGYAYDQIAKQHVSRLGGTMYVLFIILFIVAILLSFLVAKALLTPLNTLCEKAELAIKEGRTILDYKESFKEVDKLKHIINRLLMHRSSLAPGSDQPERQTVQVVSPLLDDTNAGEPSGSELHGHKTSTESPEPDDLTAPWCIIDRESYALVKLSDDFISNLCIQNCNEGMHIIEAFDTDIIQAVSKLSNGREGDSQSISLGKKEYLLEYMKNSQDKNKITLVFQERNNDELCN